MGHNERKMKKSHELLLPPDELACTGGLELAAKSAARRACVAGSGASTTLAR